MKKKGYQVIPQMFDVKPTEASSVFFASLNRKKDSKVVRLQKKVDYAAYRKKIQEEKKRKQIEKIIQRQKSARLSSDIRPAVMVSAINQRENQLATKSKIKEISRSKFPVQTGLLIDKLIAGEDLQFKPIIEKKHKLKKDKIAGLAEKSLKPKMILKVEHFLPKEIPLEEPNFFIQKTEPLIDSKKGLELKRENEFFAKNEIEGQQLEKLVNFFDKDGGNNRFLSRREKSERIFRPINHSFQAKKKKTKLIDHFFTKFKQKIKIRRNNESFFEKSKNLVLFKPALGMAFSLLSVFLVVFLIRFVSFGLETKENVIVKGKNVAALVAQAKDELADRNFDSALKKLKDAQTELAEVADDLDRAGASYLEKVSFLPFASTAASGKNLISAGEQLLIAGQEIGQLAMIASGITDKSTTEKLGLGEAFQQINQHINNAKASLLLAEEKIAKVDPTDLPNEYQGDVLKAQELLPLVNKSLEFYEKNYLVLKDLLGYNGARKYLFIFQNNQEMRATGGFIGSYGILDVSDGRVRKFFIDEIYNPDGQLFEKVVPPEPIQKISAAWSTHDANWFPNFPTSAEKIAWFYEKTGGPTVDGIIAMTPKVMEELLMVTGPIEMPDYGVTITKDNFVENIQYEVEVDYDKTENRPKKIISDLAPLILDRIFSQGDLSKLSSSLAVLKNVLQEKHILIYLFDYNHQKLIAEQGWSGEILQTSRDYLMVINSNINGFKTDGVIDETISHRAEIKSDGSVIDNVTIKRKHNGGNTKYDWWNKVNADYLRVYVPLGSQLLEASGQTREVVNEPLEYDKLGFRRDPQVEQERLSTKVDEASGTRIYQEENKTVFANWVYVSPGETVELSYRYLLPFKVDFVNNKDESGSYGVLFQKQSGSNGSKLQSEIVLGDGIELVWKYPESVQNDQNGQMFFEDRLTEDRFLGAVIKKK